MLVNEKYLRTFRFILSQTLVVKYNTDEEILKHFQNSNCQTSVKDVKFCIKLLCSYAENSIIKKFSENLDYFLVVDICQKIILIRGLSCGTVRLHLITSFMSSNKCCPLTYLSKLGIPAKNCIGIWYSAVCKEKSCYCNQIIQTKSCKIKYPLPSISKVLAYLWRTSLLLPIKDIIMDVKFLITNLSIEVLKDYFQSIIALQLEKWNSPYLSFHLAFKNIVSNFSAIQDIASLTCLKTGCLIAFGLANLNIEAYQYFSLINDSLWKFVLALKTFAESNDNRTASLQDFEKLESAHNDLIDCCLHISMKLQVHNEVPYNITGNDVTIFLSFINATVLEFKKPIYRQDLNLLESFNKVNSLSKLQDGMRNIINTSVCILENVLTCFQLPFSTGELHSSLSCLFKDQPQFQNKNHLEILHSFLNNFDDNDVQEKYKPAFLFYKYMSLCIFDNENFNIYDVLIMAK